jgi:hypothetical protein
MQALAAPDFRGGFFMRRISMIAGMWGIKKVQIVRNLMFRPLDGVDNADYYIELLWGCNINHSMNLA